MKRRKKINGILPTFFTIRDLRQDAQADYEQVSRKTYKTAARKCSEAGVPIRTGVEYRHGRAVKMLTVLQSNR